MPDHLKSLVIFYGILNCVSLFFAIVFYINNRTEKAFRHNVLYWLNMVILFLLQGALQGSHTQIILSYCSVIFLVFVIGALLNEIFDVTVPRWSHLGLNLTMAATSIGLSMFIDNFTLAAMPVSLSMAGTTLDMVRRTFVSDRNVSPSAKVFLVFVGLWALHLADYPWLRLEPTAAVPAFYVAFVFGVFMAVLIPYIIAENMRKNFTKNLEIEVRKKTLALSRANEDLHSLARHRDNLIRVLCHDTANNLSVVAVCNSNAEEILKRGTDTETLAREDRKYLDEIHAQINFIILRQTELIQSVRKFAAMESGKQEILVEPVSIAEVLSDLRKLTKEHVDRKGLNLEIDCQENMKVFSDPALLLHTVFGNLVSNAIKFSMPGTSVAIQVKPNREFCRVTVRDQGVGIPTDLLEKIFDAHDNTNRTGTMGEKGTGFGMPLVKAFLKRTGGDIHIQSQTASETSPDSGTTVIVDLPLKHRVPHLRK